MRAVFLSLSLSGVCNSEGVELTLELKNSEEVCEEVRQGRRELGVIESSIEDTDKDLLLIPYHDDELLLIVPSWHPWAGLGEVPVSALAQATLLLRELGSGRVGQR